MSLIRKIRQRRMRRAMRVKRAISTSGRVRISVFRSLNHLYVQAIDDAKKHTLASCSSNELSSGTKTEKAFEVGKKLAEILKSLQVETVVFDRSRYLYHGRVKALADGLRNGGLEL